MQSLRPIRRALLSLSDKQGLLPFAQALHAQGITLLSTGGTARLLIEAGLPITEISAYTGYPEMMDGRLKTLHPKIHGGILGRRDCDAEVMAHYQIPPIDLVVVNFYPFAQTIADPQATPEQAIENIDIGGPTMVRAAAKNYHDVAVITDSADYAHLLAQLETHQGSLPLSTRFNLACKAFAYTAAYDQAIAEYWANQCTSLQQKITPLPADHDLPQHLTLHLVRQQPLRYGENQHQKSALYKTAHSQPTGLISAQSLQGKPLSYNNLLDADTALCCVQSFMQPACVIVKHANPCGVALGTTLLEAYQGAFNSDPSSAFGSIIACNRILDLETAQCVIQQQFVEVIIAPAIAPAALSLCASKANLRLLVCDIQLPDIPAALDCRSIQGGFLLQERDEGVLSTDDLRIVTIRAPSEAEVNDALFGWKVVKFVKSNAIVYAKDNRTLGIGAGQMSRVYSAKIASLKAADQNLPLAGAIMASDAFLPFRDAIDTAAQSGITCIIQPGGSLRDAEVISAANQHGMAMIYTGMRHFRH